MIVISGVPYNAPLTSGQKQQLPLGLLPSGEANYYDFNQDRSYHGGSGINYLYPSPSGFNQASGVIRTYPPNVNPVEQSGIFSYNELSSAFSNVSQVSGLKIESFDIFNPYIHYYRIDNQPVKIPYVSTYKVSINYNPYQR
jgi:hypothetical protein